MTGAGLPHFVPGPDGFDRAVFKKEAHRDLTPAAAAMTQLDATGLLSPADYVPCEASTFCRDSHAGHLPPAPKHGRKRPPPHRSEEHTSELQSLMRISYAVFCLKKTKHTKANKKR